MMNYIKEHFIELLTLAFSSIALIVTTIYTIKGWWKNRSIYDVELLEIHSEYPWNEKNKEVSVKLNSGKYAILHTEKASSSERPDGGMNMVTGRRGPMYHILVGRIKK